MLQSEFVAFKLQHGLAIDCGSRTWGFDARSCILLYLDEIVGKQCNRGGSGTTVYESPRAYGAEDRRARVLSEKRSRQNDDEYRGNEMTGPGQ
jgi:hypothetical protein